MYRLFVAIDLPEEVKHAMAELSGDLPGARWVPREQLHLTLRFIGEVDEETFRRVKVALARVTGAAFTLSLIGIGHFPPGRHPRVLWVGMEENDLLRELQKNVELALMEADIPPDDRKFSPHITIARLKETPAAQVEAFERVHGRFASEPFPVREFHLYSSTLTPKGAIHRREKTYPLPPA